MYTTWFRPNKPRVMLLFLGVSTRAAGQIEGGCCASSNKTYENLGTPAQMPCGCMGQAPVKQCKSQSNAEFMILQREPPSLAIRPPPEKLRTHRTSPCSAAQPGLAPANGCAIPHNLAPKLQNLCATPKSPAARPHALCM